MTVLRSELPEPVKKMIDTESRVKGGHPCRPYFDVWLSKKTGGSKKEGSDEEEEEKPKTARSARPKSVGVKKEYAKKAPSSRRFPKKIIYIIIFVAAIAGLGFYYMSDTAFRQSVESSLSMPLSCSDGTASDLCSRNKPYYCRNGTLVEWSPFCGCPPGYVLRGQSCGPPNSCSDKTKASECSANKPLYCEDGTLVPKASLCGCPDYVMPSWTNVSPTWNTTTPVQFSNPRWYKPGLTYTISSDCNELQKSNMRVAFSFIMNNTQNSSLRFVEAVDGCPDITVKCLNVTVSTPLEQGVAETVVSKDNEGYYSVIKKAEITVTLGSQGCTPPVTQIHQVLHALGFAHVTDSTSMLAEKFGCLQTFKDSIKRDIAAVYPR
jgi:hypothetical protein